MGLDILTAFTLVDDRLEELRALMAEEPIDLVTERYGAWKKATRDALADLAVDSVVGAFDLASGPVGRGDGRRPTPPVFLDAAASRAFLMAIRRDLEADPASVLRLPPSEAMPADQLGILKIMDLLERRLPRAFRGSPGTKGDLLNGFETLLVGAEIAYEREGEPIVDSSGTCAPDFTFPGLSAALELELCDRPDRKNEINAWINRAIPAYRTRYPRIVFGVYDLGFIREPDRFSRAFQAHEGVWVGVIKHQSGQTPGR